MFPCFPCLSGRAPNWGLVKKKLMRVRRRDEEIANEKYAHLLYSGDDMLIVTLLITDDSSRGEERDDIKSCDIKSVD